MDANSRRSDERILDQNAALGFDPDALTAPRGLDRRSFIRRSAAVAGAVSLGTMFHEFLGRAAYGCTDGPGYGELFETPDMATGLPLLKLPEGFQYKSISWVREPLGRRVQTPTPAAFDGMAVVPVGNDRIVLIRNHEIRTTFQPSLPGAPVYDPTSPAGTSNLLFNLATAEVEQAWLSLAGTAINCAGGVTPWGTWLTCEETFANPPTSGYSKTHGWVFEVPALGVGDPRPLRAMGRFAHEAVAIDPSDSMGIVYQTEDTHTSGFYRFVPRQPGNLRAGGRLQMLRVAGSPGHDLRTFQEQDATYPVEWVNIDDPEVKNGVGCFLQGFARGGAVFARLEGCWSDSAGKVFINATTGGSINPTNNSSNGAGQVWEYDPVQMTLRCVFQSPDNGTLDNPDNLTVSPRTNNLLLCEDGGLDGQRLQVLTQDGLLAPFAVNNIVIPSVNNPRPQVPAGDYTGAEWAGACFTMSSDGQLWLFVNNFAPGITFAITGDWARGGL